jgi:hypothetical protein
MTPLVRPLVLSLLLLPLCVTGCGDGRSGPLKAEDLKVEGNPRKQYKGKGGEIEFIIYRIRILSTREVLLGTDRCDDGLLQGNKDQDGLLDSLCPFGTEDELSVDDRRTVTEFLIKSGFRGAAPAAAAKPGTGKAPGTGGPDSPTPTAPAEISLSAVRKGSGPIPMHGACELRISVSNGSGETIWVLGTSSKRRAGPGTAGTVSETDPGFVVKVRLEGKETDYRRTLTAIHPAKKTEMAQEWIPLKAGEEREMAVYFNGKGLSRYSFGRWVGPGEYVCAFAARCRGDREDPATEVEPVSDEVRFTVSEDPGNTAGTKAGPEALVRIARNLHWLRNRALSGRTMASADAADRKKFEEAGRGLEPLRRAGGGALTPLAAFFSGYWRMLQGEPKEAETRFGAALRSGMDPWEYGWLRYAVWKEGGGAGSETKRLVLERLTGYFDCSVFSRMRDRLLTRERNPGETGEGVGKVVERIPIPAVEKLDFLALGKAHEEIGDLDAAAWCYTNALGNALYQERSHHAAVVHWRLGKIALAEGDRDLALRRVYFALVCADGRPRTGAHALFQDLDDAKITEDLADLLKSPSPGKVQMSRGPEMEDLEGLARAYADANLFGRVLGIQERLETHFEADVAKQKKEMLIRWGKALHKNLLHRKGGAVILGEVVTMNEVDGKFRLAGFHSAKDFFTQLWIGQIDENGNPK